MSQLLPRSSHSPTQPQPSQTTDPEAPPVTPVLAKQNIEPRNPQWQDIIMGFCLTSALQIALQYIKTPSQLLPLSFHLLSLTVVLTFSALFVAKLIGSKYPVPAQVVNEVAVFFVTTAFFLAITIPMPLYLKFLSWAIYVVLLTVFVFSFFLVQELQLRFTGDSIVIRNFQGEPTAAKAGSEGLTMNPTEAELFAAIDLGFRKIVLEGDSL
nr:hypothetical protein CFP56_65587 [Quercus suber]